MFTSATQVASSKALYTDVNSGVIATLDLACHSPFTCDDKDRESANFYLNSLIKCKDMQKIAQVMPPLMKAPHLSTSDEEINIWYYTIDSGRKRYVYGFGNID